MIKDPPANAGDMGLIPESGKSPRRCNGNSLLYSCPENSMHRGIWRATVHGVTESDMTAHTHTCCLQPTTLSHRGNFTKMVLSYYYKALSRQKSQVLTSLESKIPNAKIFNSLELICTQTGLRKMEPLNENVLMV